MIPGACENMKPEHQGVKEEGLQVKSEDIFRIWEPFGDVISVGSGQ
jgi:hypothetical protein